MADFLQRTLPEYGFDQIVQDPYGNVLGRIGQSAAGGLLFDAHLDTVAVHNPEDWHHDPYGGEVWQDKIFGRGIADMKGALAAAIVAVGELRLEGWEPSGPFWLSGTVGEEVAEGAMLEKVLDRVQPETTIIGESTGLQLAVGQRGRAEIILDVKGRSAHSAHADLGINAITGAMQALAEVAKLEAPSSGLGEGSLVATDIISSPYPGRSVVPSGCRITLDRRVLLGETPTSVLEGINNSLPSEINARAKLARYAFQTYTGRAVTGDSFAPAWYFEPSQRRVREALTALNRAGIQAGPTTYGFCTNGSGSAGKRGIFTLGFGPGHEADAHTTDESLAVDQLLGAVQGYKALFRSLLRREENVRS